MASTVLVLDPRCLRAFAYPRVLAHHDCDCRGQHGLSPAPGGPIKIMRMLLEEDGAGAACPDSLCSSSTMRFSSRETNCLRSSTAVSVMGAIVSAREG